MYLLFSGITRYNDLVNKSKSVSCVNEVYHTFFIIFEEPSRSCIFKNAGIFSNDCIEKKKNYDSEFKLYKKKFHRKIYQKDIHKLNKQESLMRQ